MSIGITLMILWHILGSPTLAWLFTRIPPADPAGWQPRQRNWTNGIEQ